MDSIFGGFDLTDRASYAAFLSAHAAVLLPLEDVLDAGGIARLIDDWPSRRRAAAVLDDLADLGRAAPAPIAPPALPSDAAIVGATYVLEGSRLGGRMLARQVPAEFPRRYLDADQPKGHWAALLAQVDTVLYDPARVTEAIDSARAVFASFEASGRAWLARVE